MQLEPEKKRDLRKTPPLEMSLSQKPKLQMQLREPDPLKRKLPRRWHQVETLPPLGTLPAQQHARKQRQDKGLTMHSKQKKLRTKRPSETSQLLELKQTA
jgi:hypothetical protein